MSGVSADPQSALTQDGFVSQAFQVRMSITYLEAIREAQARASESLVGCVAVSRRDFVKIAQRFNAGLSHAQIRSPEGTTEGCLLPCISIVPPGLASSNQSEPSVETLGYYRMSLRDNRSLFESA